MNSRLVPIAPAPPNGPSAKASNSAGPPVTVKLEVQVPQLQQRGLAAAASAGPLNGHFLVSGNPPPATTSVGRVNDADTRSPEMMTPFANTSDKRRATHNEVERRRRDTINSWILKLGKLIPDLMSQEAGPPKTNLMSKGGILARACEYLTELKKDKHELNERLREREKENERLKSQLALLQDENDLLKRELEPNDDDEDDEDAFDKSEEEDEGMGLL